MTTNKDIRHHTAEELKTMQARGEDATNWRRIDALTKDELEAAIDHEDEGDFDWNQVTVGMPTSKKQLTVRFDLDVVEWFRAQGAGYQTRMNQVLRSYVEARSRK
ncbi:MAG: BrnA antitoxin family protein [Thermomicrobiales bacterium]